MNKKQYDLLRKKGIDFSEPEKDNLIENTDTMLKLIGETYLSMRINQKIMQTLTQYDPTNFKGIESSKVEDKYLGSVLEDLVDAVLREM